MSVMTPTRRRQPRGRSRARRNDKPVPCQRCRRLIVFGFVEESGGGLRKRPDGRVKLLPLDADPVGIGAYEYVRGPVARPVVRELLDAAERLAPTDTLRYSEHQDIPASPG